MQRFHLVIIGVAFVLLVAGCGEGSEEDSGLATLESTTTTSTVTDEGVGTEEAILAFSRCMRDHGIAGFPDPSFNADGSLDFRRGQTQLEEAGIATDSPEFREAFDACRELLQGVALIGGGIDLTEVQDLLLEFARCMREQGVDVPDPDFSFAAGGGTPFGSTIDFNDPDVRAAFEVCQQQVNFQRFLDDASDGPSG